MIMSNTMNEQADKPQTQQQTPANDRQQQAMTAMIQDMQTQRSRRMAERDNQPVRINRVNAIKQQIADGTYESDEKIDLTLDRLLVDLEIRPRK